MIQTIIISGMSCQHCVRAASAALECVAGVDAVEIDLQSGRARVDGQADAADLIAAIVAAGYGAELEKAG